MQQTQIETVIRSTFSTFRQILQSSSIISTNWC